MPFVLAAAQPDLYPPIHFAKDEAKLEECERAY